MALNNWRTWLRSLSPSPRRHRARERRRPPYRPARVEQLEVRLAPATEIWLGAVATSGTGTFDWSNPANWSLSRAPVPGDDLVFDTTNPSAARVTNNDLPALTEIDSITISTGSNNGYTLGGNQIILGNPGVGGNVIVNSNSTKNTISLDVQMGGAASDRQFFTINQSADLTYSGHLSGTTGVTLSKDGAGTLYFTNDNSAFTGPITVDVGILQITNPNALGDLSNGTTVEPNAQLQLKNVGTVQENLTINGVGPKADGALLNVSGDNVWAGTITLDSDSTLGAAADVLNVTGQVTDLGGGHNLTKEGVAQIIFSHAGGNTYRGQTIINNGVLTIEDPLALGPDAAHGGGTVLSGTVVNSTLTEQGQLQIVDPSGSGFTVLDEVLILYGNYTDGSGALLNVQGNNTWAGSVILGTPSLHTPPVSIGVAANTTLTISGVVSDLVPGNPLIKVGSGELVLNNANTYIGTTTVAQGILDIRDSQALGAGGGGGTTVLTGTELELDFVPGFDAHGRNLSDDSVTGFNGNGPQHGMTISTFLTLFGTGVNNDGALHSIVGINKWVGPIFLGDASADVAIGVEPDPIPTPNNSYFTHDYSLTVSAPSGIISDLGGPSRFNHPPCTRSTTATSS
jgi:autotransporter-associated beta strand protein